LLFHKNSSNIEHHVCIFMLLLVS